MTRQPVKQLEGLESSVTENLKIIVDLHTG